MNPFNLKTYVILRADHYLSLLGVVGSIAMYAAFHWNFFAAMVIVSSLYNAITFVRDWRDSWHVFQVSNYSPQNTLETPHDPS